MENKLPRILIVDDDLNLLTTMNDILKIKGFEPFNAQTGTSALSQLEDREFDVALIDLRLDDMSGLEVLSAIKARTPETECILLTGHATQDSAIQAMQMDAFGYFQKPFAMEQVLLSIQRAVEKRQFTRALRESEARYRAVIHSATDAIISADNTGKIIGWNPGAERIFGYTEIEAHNQPLVLLLPAIYRERHMAGMAAQVQSGSTLHMVGKTVEVEGRRKDGSEFPLELSLAEWQVADGKFYTAIIRDITERKQAEEQLTQSHGLLANLARLVPGVIYQYRLYADGRSAFPYSSPGINDIYEVTPEEVREDATPIFGRLHPEDFDRVAAAIQESAHTLNEFYCEFRVILPRQGLRWRWSQAHPERTDDGGTLWHGIISDITERKMAENVLSRTNLRLQSLRLIDHALLGATVESRSADIEALRHLAVLVPCGKISIIALDEISDSAKISALVAGEDLSVNRVNEPVEIGELRLKTMQDEEISVLKLGAGKLNPFEKRLYNAGERSLVKAPLIVQGKLIGILTLSSADGGFFTSEYLEIIKDVSAQLALSLHHQNLLNEIRRHAEQLEKRVQERTAEIESTRRRLELAVNAGEIGVWDANFKENKVVWDKRMHLIHGTSPDDFDNSLDTWWAMIHPQDIDQTQNRIQEALNLTGLYVDEHRVLRPDGSLRHVTANAVVLYDADRQPERMIGVNVDVTDRKLVEETMRRANLEMERALRTKDEFLANMSHELRTPLNAVMGISESLLEQTIGALNEKQQKYISTINESGVHLLSLINDILDLSKIEAGRMELNITDVSVKSLFESSFRMVKEMAQKKNISISFEEDERAQTMRGDPRRLLQMLVNLLSNAIKFTPEGGKAGVQAIADPDLDEIKFTVWDTGIGISEADMPRLFKSFVQLDSNLSREYPGTGLGLMLVMQMARMHGGNISVQSNPNQGSRFTISLPWSPREDQPSGRKMIEKAAPSLPQEKRRTGRILLVEDTESIIMLLRDYLQNKGHRVLMAGDGLSGVEMAKSERPDLILMDIQMPGMDGFEATEQIRAQKSLRDIPIVALTAMAMPGDRERCLAAGMNGYISKPLHLNELSEIIERLLWLENDHD